MTKKTISKAGHVMLLTLPMTVLATVLEVEASQEAIVKDAASGSGQEIECLAQSQRPVGRGVPACSAGDMDIQDILRFLADVGLAAQ